MTRDEQEATLNLHGWRPVIMQVQRRNLDGNFETVLAHGMTKGYRFVYPRWSKHVERVVLGVRELTGPTTAIDADWDSFEDEALHKLMLWAIGATSGQTSNGGYVPPQ